MVTLDDVAKNAGVSPSTVSIVVNNRTVRGVSVSSTTRERVLRVAKTMGYTPNSLARAVATGKNRVFGLIQEQGASEVLMRIMYGCQQELDAVDYLIKPFSVREKSTIYDVVKKCLGQRVAGIVAFNLSEDDLPVVLHEAGLAKVAVVTVDSPTRHEDCVQIISDNSQGVHLMVDHLARIGHRKIAFIGGPADSTVSQARKRFFLDACRENNVVVDPEDVIDTSWGMHEIMEDGLEPIWERPKQDRPTALFCAGDPIAMVSVRAARRHGLNVPNDISVVGFANSSFAYLADPSLTTIEQNFHDIGRTAIKVLLASESGKDNYTGERIVKIPTSLVVRESAWGPRTD